MQPPLTGGQLRKPFETSLRRQLSENDLATIVRPTENETSTLNARYKDIDKLEKSERRKLLAMLDEFHRREVIDDLKALSNAGDEIWEFDSSQESWDQGMGIRGFELVRSGAVVKRTVTAMN